MSENIRNKSAANHLKQLEPDKVDWQAKDDSFWRAVLSPDQYRVCREGGTERPFTGKYNEFKTKGVYLCSNCGLELFSSEAKFDSGTGWPSFTQPISPESVLLRSDRSFGMVRTEVVCSRCAAHLGHMFDDGPRPTGKRYCVNSVCLLHKENVEK